MYIVTFAHFVIREQVCIDCSYEHLMTAKEINSLSQQIRYCYASNRRSKNPVYLSVANLAGTTLDHMKNVAGFPDQWKSRAFSYSETKSVVELHDPDAKSKLVYLTSDSDTVLEHLDDSKIYIIGGIVDRNRLKRAAISRAETFGLPTAKLPITDYFKLVTTKVLTCNHVFEILIKYRELGNDWKKAMLDVLPVRKDIKMLEEQCEKSKESEDGKSKVNADENKNV